jgi:hypothetical protein
MPGRLSLPLDRMPYFHVLRPFCSATSLGRVWRPMSMRAAMFIAARIKTSWSVNPRVVILHITHLTSKRRLSSQGNYRAKGDAVITARKMCFFGATLFEGHCRKLVVSTVHQHWRHLRQEWVPSEKPLPHRLRAGTLSREKAGITVQ